MASEQQRASLMLAIVSAALLLDSVTLTMVVPIIPDYLLTTDKELTRETVHRMRNGSNSRGQQEADLDADSENTRVALLLSSKAITQLVLNPVVGQWTNVSGCSIPLFFGTCVLLLTTTLFAAGDSYFTLFIARACQGVASACIGVTGMCLLADTYGSEPDRSRAMGLALSSAACGVLIGYPFGGFFYDLFGKTPAFVIVGMAVFTLIVIQFHWLKRDAPDKDEIGETGWIELATDRRVLLCGGTIGVSTAAMAILEPCLPLWLLGHIKTKKWQLGTVFIPDSLGYALGTNAFSQIAYKEGRVRVAAIAMIVIALSCLAIPLASNMAELVLPHFLLGLGIGAVDAAIVPMLASLADGKKVKRYGTVYTVQQAAVCLAYALGPIFGGALVKALGFAWLMMLVGVMNLLYCCLIAKLLGFTKEPLSLLEEQSVEYTNTNGYSSFNEQ